MSKNLKDELSGLSNAENLLIAATFMLERYPINIIHGEYLTLDDWEKTKKSLMRISPVFVLVDDLPLVDAVSEAIARRRVACKNQKVNFTFGGKIRGNSPSVSCRMHSNENYENRRQAGKLQVESPRFSGSE
jgi:hypothetical protein